MVADRPYNTRNQHPQNFFHSLHKTGICILTQASRLDRGVIHEHVDMPGMGITSSSVEADGQERVWVNDEDEIGIVSEMICTQQWTC